MLKSTSLKRIIAVLIAVSLVLSLGMSAFATSSEASTTATAETETNPASKYSTLIQIALFGGIIVVFYFLIIRPQSKKEKEAKKMRNNVEVGDKIVTIGGIMGKVCSVKDDNITIETGADKVRIKFLKSAISSVQKPGELPVEKK